MSYSSKTVLAIDTVIGDGSISLWRKGVELNSRLLESGAPQSETLLEALRHTLTLAKIELNQVDCIAVSVGPGSYTGIRVGIATVLGIAAANECETIGMSTLRTMASVSNSGTAQCLAVLTIGGEDLISQQFEWKNGKLAEVNSPQIISIEQLSNLNLHEIITDRKTHLKVDGRGIKVEVAPDNFASLIAEALVNDQIIVSPDELVPIYSREFIAKAPKS